MLFFRSPPAGLLIPSSRTVDNMQRENIVGKAGKMNGKDRSWWWCKAKERQGLLDCRIQSGVGEYEKGQTMLIELMGILGSSQAPKLDG